ncbi:unnamed protein product [Sphagnum troendelagicum]|uniref:Uncharacterized protein n=1 Tax=Sphagnum troendelagicum TaxID=128251 RepID=A0ABP0U7U7_9BRYO
MQLLSDKEVFNNAIQASKDAHGLSMDIVEDGKVKAEEALRKKTYDEGINYMVQRNRERITEIWFVVKQHQDEINGVFKQIFHGDVSSVRS